MWKDKELQGAATGQVEKSIRQEDKKLKYVEAGELFQLNSKGDDVVPADGTAKEDVANKTLDAYVAPIVAKKINRHKRSVPSTKYKVPTVEVEAAERSSNPDFETYQDVMRCGGIGFVLMLVLAVIGVIVGVVVSTSGGTSSSSASGSTMTNSCGGTTKSSTKKKTTSTSSGSSSITSDPTSVSYSLADFAIGDWGSTVTQDSCCTRSSPYNDYDINADDSVANVMNQQAGDADVPPKIIISYGDNWYWTGINSDDGRDTRFTTTFEDKYDGNNIKTIPWANVLGNHDCSGPDYICSDLDDGTAACASSTELVTALKNKFSWQSMYSFGVSTSGVSIGIFNVDLGDADTHGSLQTCCECYGYACADDDTCDNISRGDDACCDNDADGGIQKESTSGITMYADYVENVWTYDGTEYGFFSLSIINVASVACNMKILYAIKID
ncbi:hypothetical protein BBJ29_009194 [Phytophthora kernoviae]|uniref:Calcineurin-like phosphoesterase domain-containing protein n=1 Tax=Phytophthora kernoviae TaxID=325452 RepID=A0A3F2RCM1_9STRA|nr:hypothetical protein BBJ29_009194 [Phytophthora kernoviae]RLN53053.1 hypothetical protein BBP00_00009437 [Phytophthora kernoviae]